MAQVYPEFELPRWVLNSASTTSTPIAANLAGSAATPVSLEDLINLSTDPETTRRNLQFQDLKLGLGEYAGDARLRQTITELYDKSLVDVQADDVVIANATTGANLLVLQALLKPGDHVVALYPCYGQLERFPEAMGCRVSRWRLRPDRDWRLEVEDLRRLIREGGEGNRPTMLILNNPHNPTGTVLSSERQREIVKVCEQHDIVVLSDEIFRPLFHESASSAEGGQHPATSLLEHSSKDFDKMITTGSLSKPYGLSGIRVGWAVTTNPELRRILISMRQWSISSISVVDEVIGRETLSSRCRGPLVEITLASARANLKLLREVVEGSKGRLQCKFPAAGGTAFVRVFGEDGKTVVDDVAFCTALLEKEGMLLAPGSLTFGGIDEGDFQGFVRVHVTAPPQMFAKGMEGLQRFLKDGASS